LPKPVPLPPSQPLQTPPLSHLLQPQQQQVP
jgi:hypothetical protein